jgi:hypothetical protein
VLKEFVELSKARQAGVEARFRAGLSSKLDTEAAHCFRIDAELELSRTLERQKP